jgi:hypothetical protein
MIQTLAHEGVTYMASVKTDSTGKEVISAEAINDELGNLKEVTFFSDTNHITEKYTYDKLNRMTEVYVLRNGKDWSLQMKNVYNELQERETNFEYAEDGTVYRTEYLNNPSGKNISNRFYIDDQLKHINLFYWSNDCLLDSVIRFDADSSKTGGKVVMSYDKGLLKSRLTYEHQRVLEIEKYEYNDQGLRSLVIYEIPNESRRSTITTFENKLPISEMIIYESLTDGYQDTSQLKWSYKKTEFNETSRQ